MCNCKCVCKCPALTWEEPKGCYLTAYLSKTGERVGWVRPDLGGEACLYYHHPWKDDRTDGGKKPVLVDVYRNTEAAKAALEKMYTLMSHDDD